MLMEIVMLRRNKTWRGRLTTTLLLVRRDLSRRRIGIWVQSPGTYLISKHSSAFLTDFQIQISTNCQKAVGINDSDPERSTYWVRYSNDLSQSSIWIDERNWRSMLQ
jgi:hypothetical protein